MSDGLRAEAATNPVRVEELRPDDEPAWEAFVAAFPGASHYHRVGWARVIRNAFRHRPIYLVARRDGRIEGILPIIAFSSRLFGRHLVSMPYLNRGGVLARTEEAHTALLEETGRLLRVTGSSSCELRHVGPSGRGLPARTDKVSMSLAVAGGVEALWKGLDAKVRNLVRKADKSGVEVREGHSGADLAAFYDVFARNMRDLGTPVYTRRFFEEILREFGGDARLTVAERRGVALAGALCISWQGVTEIHWAAARRAARPYAANMTLYWEAIRHAAETGAREFCFGRSTEGSGPHRFKQQWGAFPTRLHWEYLLAAGAAPPSRRPDDPRYRLAIRAWRRLPLALTRWVGPPIVRHLP